MKIITFVESLPTEFTALKVPILCVPKEAAGKYKLFYKQYYYKQFKTININKLYYKKLINKL